MQPNRLRRASQLAVVLAGAFVPIQAHAQSTIAYGVANFGDAGECDGGNSSHAVHEDTPFEFMEVFDHLKASGKWTTTKVLLNKSVRGSRFTDPSKNCGGDSPCAGEDNAAGLGADNADVMFIHTHGRHSVSKTLSWLSMGNSNYDCAVSTADNMLWNSNLDIAVVKACQSADLEVYKAGGYRGKFTTPSSSLSVWNGFHGDSSCSWTYTDSDVNAYAWESQREGVGENWIDEFYMGWVGVNNDDCPVSIVMGDSKAKRDSMFRHGGWLERHDTGTKSASTYFFVNDCAPDHGMHLPD